MNQNSADLESAHFRQGIARAWLRVERRKRLSYRLGYLCGRVNFYWNLIVRRRHRSG